MKKVKYSVIRYTKKGSYRFTGYGEIDDENLYTHYKNSNGETVNKTYEDCIRYLHKIPETSNEFKGGFSEYETIEFENDKGYMTELEVETCYNIWIKILD